VRKIVLLARRCSINADIFWEPTQINISKGTFGERRGDKKSNGVQHKSTRRLVYRGSVPKNLVPVEEATKAESIPTLSLSQSVTQTGRVLLLNHLGH
jgi:hypothetical protein